MLCSTLIMRTFVALDLEAGIRSRIRAFIASVEDFAPEARWAREESLHVTLKFIGERPGIQAEEIEAALGSVRAEPFQLKFKGAGFFPTPTAARVFWIGIEAEDGLLALGTLVEEALESLGIEREKRVFHPHLTLARASGASRQPGRHGGAQPSRQFRKLEAHLKRHPLPEFGEMRAREFFLYRSQLSRHGSVYTKIARFELRQASD
ncbi:MAG: RNA 2',3'-cyclic phosphodiesterase [Acidobacteria bacterium]|nr:RNA 2',3'-cyclic phosphodiesterase [Acidobacteriota bacterium]